jgi:hypothetical protein
MSGPYRRLRFARRRSDRHRHALETKISARDAVRWATGAAADWAKGRYAVSQAHSYIIQSRTGCTSDQVPLALSASYQGQALATAELQLEKAGVCLALVLNTAAAKAVQTASRSQ